MGDPGQAYARHSRFAVTKFFQIFNCRDHVAGHQTGSDVYIDFKQLFFLLQLPFKIGFLLPVSPFQVPGCIGVIFLYPSFFFIIGVLQRLLFPGDFSSITPDCPVCIRHIAGFSGSGRFLCNSRSSRTLISGKDLCTGCNGHHFAYPQIYARVAILRIILPDTGNVNKKGPQQTAEGLDYLSGVPKGIRTPVAGVKGRCPGPG